MLSPAPHAILVGTWMRANKVRLNMEVFLVQKSKMHVQKYHPALSGATIPFKEQFHSLGGCPDLQVLLNSQVVDLALCVCVRVPSFSSAPAATVPEVHKPGHSDSFHGDIMIRLF